MERMQTHVSSMLVQLAGPNRFVDPCLCALVPAAALRSSAASRMQREGVTGLLSMGSELDRLVFSPALYLLESALDVATVAERWRALESAWGVEHRTALQLERRTMGIDLLPFGGKAAPAAQRWTIVGVVMALLRARGHRGVALSHRSGSGRWIEGLPRLEASALRLSWDSEPTRVNPRLALGADAETLVGRCIGLLETEAEASRAGLARKLGTSVRTLQRRVQARGETVGMLERRLRMRSATVALAESRRSATEIAHEMGFSDAAHFTRSFRVAAGMTPSAYRTLAHRR